MRPGLRAHDARVLWAPEVFTSTVFLIDSPFPPSDRGNLFRTVGNGIGTTDSQGVHSRYDLGNGDRLQILTLFPATMDQPLAALVPLDADGPDRLEAIDRLLRALLGRPVPPDTRLTPQQRRRARHMLQAADGRGNGASYRDIASVLFGPDRVADQPWKSSPLRDVTMDLVRDAFAMIAGGYRALLRRRRRGS